MHDEILGFEYRRRWSDQETLGIVISAGADAVTSTQVTQRLDSSRQKIHA
jgi:transposase